MSVDRLIDELRREGRHDSRGEFTLDRDKAREKMRRFQLASPEAYVTELVQAALLKGATRVEIEVDADDTVLRFDGPAFTVGELYELWSSVFSTKVAPEVRALRQLALGINGALGRNPRRVTLTSAGDDLERAATMELRPGREDRIEVRPARRPGTRIHVKKRLTVGRISDFVDNLFGEHPEEVRIREHCRYCETPIILEGERVSHGLAAAKLLAGVEIEGDGVVGVAGFEAFARRSEMRILSSGVLVVAERLDREDPLPFVAVVEGTGLKKNVARSGYVQDQAYTRLVWTVLAARERAVAELGRMYLRREPVPELSEGRILAALQHEASRITTLEPLTAGDPDAFPRILARVPRWFTASGSGTMLSVDDLVADLGDSDRVCYARRTFEGHELGADLERVAYLRSASEAAAFRTLFADRVLNVTRRLENEIKRRRNRRQWRERAQTAALSRGVYRARAAISGPQLRGEIGIPGSGRQETVVRYVKDGHLLHRAELELPIPGCELVLEAPFQPTKNFDGVRRDRTLARALLAAVRVLPALAEDLALAVLGSADGGLGGRQLLRFLELFSDPGHPAVLLVGFGFTAAAADRHVERAARERPFAAPDLGPESRSPLVAVPCFVTAAGPAPVALRDLHRRLAERGSIPFVAADAELVRRPEDLVLRLDRWERSVLAKLLGDGALEPFREPGRKKSGERRQKSRRSAGSREPPRPPEREPEVAGRGEAAVEPPPAPPAPEAEPTTTEEPRLVSAVPRRRKKIRWAPAKIETDVSPARTVGRSAEATESPEVMRENRLLDALRAELEGVAKPGSRLLRRLDLERLHFVDGELWMLVASHSSRGVGLHRRNRLVAAALERFESDPAIVTFLASAVYTVLNEALRAVTDDDERSFHLRLAARAAQRLGGPVS